MEINRSTSAFSALASCCRLPPSIPRRLSISSGQEQGHSYSDKHQQCTVPVSQVKATIHEQVAGCSGVGLESQLVEANVGGTVQGQSELVMQAGRLARTHTRTHARMQ